jgi:hypothetical protein
VAKATGASIVMTLADMDGNESFDASSLGSAEEVVEESVGDNDMLMIRGPRNTRAVTVLLRGANDYLLDEMDRSLHDAFCIVKRVLESGSVVPGELPHAACQAGGVGIGGQPWLKPVGGGSLVCPACAHASRAAPCARPQAAALWRQPSTCTWRALLPRWAAASSWPSLSLQTRCWSSPRRWRSTRPRTRRSWWPSCAPTTTPRRTTRGRRSWRGWGRCRPTRRQAMPGRCLAGARVVPWLR